MWIRVVYAIACCRGANADCRPNPARSELTLRELEHLTCFRTTRLLTLDRARIAREETERAELTAVSFVDLDQRAGHSETQRACLARRATAIDVGLHVVPTKRVGGDECLLNGRDVRRTGEVVTQGASIHVPFAGARLQENAADRLFAAADRMDVLRVRHVLLLALGEGQRL